jgi:MerR family copper efflux transcriptional regulator
MKKTTATKSSLTIGAVAKHTGFSIDTIRFYERKGLLPDPVRRPSGYRIYHADTLERLRFIRRAKNLGFQLDEIIELLALSEDNQQGVKGVRQRARQHLEKITQRIETLQRIRDSLTQLVDACPGKGDTDNCPILHALTDENDLIPKDVCCDEEHHS